MEKQTRKEWQQPTVEVLDVNMTMGGPNGVFPDKNGKGSNKGHAFES
ncbi:paeninodin family lasso peptide [Paenibacillus lignilyticus]|uniref:Paeninodin family lasso peptide n=1 Tax=Paenibacillus lignilyticus TaxID=1172615 RepID=A0ABS5C718_9BACL|nr:paeninodin family lasso peptide [Paenibacillus lignilyticus]MBP3961796.1 paeninodin family lasso peptide [Paenibacillus lignilyticus]MBP3963533.1 paeninodin family lasso peptide [Paenibacillus lignilyticus]